MKIGIIGAGHIGSVLARKFSRLKHNILIANSRGPESLTALAAETGARPVDTADAVKGVDLVIITIPEKNIEQLPKDLFLGVPDSVVVVDTGNYYPDTRDGVMPDLEKAPSESSWVSQKIGRPVIKVFNSIIAYSLANAGLPRGTGGRLALPVSGDDPKAKTTVMSLVEELGFDAVDAGSLNESWRQQPGTPAYCTNLNAGELRKVLAGTDRERSQRLRKIAEEGLKTLSPDAPPDTLVKMSRELQQKAA
jgi:predicted dinucleotide-binding enzyme